MQDVVALLEPLARDHVGQREHLGVAHVQVAGRVGEHVQQVAPLARCRRRDARNGSSSCQTFSHFSWAASTSYVDRSSRCSLIFLLLSLLTLLSVPGSSGWFVA